MSTDFPTRAAAQPALDFDARSSASAQSAKSADSPESSVPLTADESAVWKAICTRFGAAAAVPIAAIHARTGLSERSIKAAVEGLIQRHDCKVGSSRKPPHGYFLIATAAELEATCHTIESQAFSELRRSWALKGKQSRYWRELLGQQGLELSHE